MLGSTGAYLGTDQVVKPGQGDRVRFHPERRRFRPPSLSTEHPSTAVISNYMTDLSKSNLTLMAPVIVYMQRWGLNPVPWV